jgi:protein gp37
VNRTLGKSSIDYCDYAFNAIEGCRHGCLYCYAAAMAKRYGKSFEPHFHPERLGQPFNTKKPGVVFVTNIGDIFSPGVKEEWREHVRAACDAAPWHTYLWLTKDPPRYTLDWGRSNWWLGATITGPEDFYKREVWAGFNRWYSYEPLCGIPTDDHFPYQAEQVIIGAATRSQLPYSVAWGKAVAKAYEGTPVFVKSNGRWPGAPRELAWPLAKSGGTA